ncbi:OLC1v1007457C1 [Oldenlandia corymbosa var. corymbosa]|uniref:OLC1v1007457C1 n=1 Tax=Oldenlandia corymbosa var. corymbosa TaxID=529605 RepID=A0AAV1DLN3_OLDCO|nr:OLC1v1007457C1 [Oldenlandia corymbosa var. corymbosa]
MAISSFRAVNRINIALHDTELRENRTPPLANDLKKQSIRLRNLKAFVVVSARKLAKDGRRLESLLARIEDVVSRSPTAAPVTLVTVMEALSVQITFLKNFLLFATHTGVANKHLENLLTHFKAVVVNAAPLLIKSPADELNKNWCQEMQSRCSILIQRIKPIDPQNYS